MRLAACLPPPAFMQSECAPAELLADKLFRELPPELLSYMISRESRRGLVLVDKLRCHKPLTKDSLDCNQDVVLIAFDVFPSGIPSKYTLAAAIVQLDEKVKGGLLKACDLAEKTAKAMHWAIEYRRLLQKARSLGRRSSNSRSEALLAMKRKLQFPSRADGNKAQKAGPATHRPQRAA